VNGWICTDVADMADRIASTSIDATVCREFVAQRFSIADMTDRYVDLYERVVERSTPLAAELEA
jgi:hypothetical protein